MIEPEDRDPGAFLDHLYVQWLGEEQLAGFSSRVARKQGRSARIALPEQSAAPILTGRSPCAAGSLIVWESRRDTHAAKRGRCEETPHESRTDRLIFDDPVSVRRIELCFEERETARTQEFSLHWSTDDERSLRELLRQKYTFSPPGTAREVERYAVDLHDVAVIELRLTPDIAGGPTPASLNRLRVW